MWFSSLRALLLLAARSRSFDHHREQGRCCLYNLMIVLRYHFARYMYGLCHEWFVYQSIDLPSRTKEGEGRNVYVLCVYVYVLYTSDWQ